MRKPPPTWCSVRKLSLASGVQVEEGDEAVDWRTIMLVKRKYTVGEVKLLLERHLRVSVADQLLQTLDSEMLEDDSVALCDCGIPIDGVVTMMLGDPEMNVSLEARSLKLQKDEYRRQLKEERFQKEEFIQAKEALQMELKHI